MHEELPRGKLLECSMDTPTHSELESLEVSLRGTLGRVVIACGILKRWSCVVSASPQHQGHRFVSSRLGLDSLLLHLSDLPRPSLDLSLDSVLACLGPDHVGWLHLHSLQLLRPLLDLCHPEHNLNGVGHLNRQVEAGSVRQNTNMQSSYNFRMRFRAMEPNSFTASSHSS